MPGAPATQEIWTELVERTLKGASLERLVSRSADDLPIEPLYSAASVGHAGPLRPAGRWRIAQRLDHPNPAQASALALSEVGGGADELVLAFTGAPTARGFGVDAQSPGTLDVALAGLDLTALRLRIETAPFDGRPIAELMLGFLSRRCLEAKDLDIAFGLDPASDMARMGGLPLPWQELARRFAGSVAMLRERGFAHGLARVDGRAAHEAAASEAQELAFALATGVAYLRTSKVRGSASTRPARPSISCWWRMPTSSCRSPSSAPCGGSGPRSRRLAVSRPSRSRSAPRRLGG